MPAAPLPPDEEARLAELHGLDLLDTVPEPAYDDLTALAAKIAGTPISLVSLIDEDRQWFKSRVGLEATETPREDAFCAHAILEPDRTMVVQDATRDARFSENPLVVGEPGIRFYAGTPLVTSTGQALGTLCVIDTRPRLLTEAQRTSLEAIGRQVVAQVELRRALRGMEAAALVQAHHEEKLERYQQELEDRIKQLAELSLRDGLTGLWNRVALTERLDEAMAVHRRQALPVAVVMVDIDHFKARNDDFGHPAGDRALKAMAAALRSATREEDVVARYGGEEFTVVLSDADLDGALLAAERMRLAVERIDLPEGPLTASFGIATAQPDRDDAASLLAAADGALYEAKDAGRNCVRAAETSSAAA